MTTGRATTIDLFLGPTGLTGITLALARDGGNLTTPAGGIVEKSGGFYTWSATADDMQFNDAVLVCSHDELSSPVRYQLSTVPAPAEVRAVILDDFRAIGNALTTLQGQIGGVEHRLSGVYVSRCWAIDPVTGNMLITPGDTYAIDRNNAYSWAVDGIDLTGASVKFEVDGNNFTADMTAVVYAPGRWTVTLALTGNQSRQLPEGNYRIRAYYPDNDRVTLPVTGRVKKQGG